VIPARGSCKAEIIDHARISGVHFPRQAAGCQAGFGLAAGPPFAAIILDLLAPLLFFEHHGDVAVGGEANRHYQLVAVGLVERRYAGIGRNHAAIATPVTSAQCVNAWV
jgi:hypothetical protein